MIKNLYVDFVSGQEKSNILSDINLQIRHGEILALVGESGSGKSVLAQAIMQLLGVSGRISQGEIWFNGESLHNKNQRQMQDIRGKKIGMIFQDPMMSLNPTMTVGRQIAEGMIYHEKISHGAARIRVIELMKQVGIADPSARFDAYPFQLSGGMRQRIAIAIALACRPLMLIADEPTTALDVTVQAQILELIKKIGFETGMSLLLITHDLGIVAGVCDRVAVMHDGELVEVSDVEQLFYSPQHPYTQTLLAARRLS